MSKAGGISRGRTLLTGGALPWALASLVLVLAGAGIYFSTGNALSEPSTAQAPGARDIAFGPEDARVTLIEYSDFECEFCADYAKMLAVLRTEYGDQVRFVYRFFPLAKHRFAMVSAQAAYAASLQDKFWEMHDLLYDKQKEWSEAADPYLEFEAYANLLGLDIDRFQDDFKSQSTKDFILSELAEGTRAGVDHTPWFILNGSVVTPRSLDKFESLIEAAL